MGKELYLEEWIIEKIYDYEDSFGNHAKKGIIRGHAHGADIPLYLNDLSLLQTILTCDEDQLIGKSIIAVVQGQIVRAIGYQGLYIPLYYRDGSSELLSENELCNLLDSFYVNRIDKRGEIITSYEVSPIELGSKMCI